MGRLPGSTPNKTLYRTTNWPEYKRSLQSRGSLTAWMSPDILWLDSTGIEICGEGEWKVKKHGAEYRRSWRKVHLAINAETLDVRAVEMTDLRQDDAAYGTRSVYQAAHTRGAEVIVPPSRNAKPWKDKTAFVHGRNETLAARHLGWRLWKKWSGYHRRSLVEMTMLRVKLLGEQLAAREPERQAAEVHVRCAILNTFNRLGMPVTVAFA